MVRWKSEAVVAWLELVVQMPMYSKACSENVKSGKVRGVKIFECSLHSADVFKCLLAENVLIVIFV